MGSDASAPAGFCARLTAGLIDLLSLGAVVWCAAYVSAGSGRYLPLEATVLAVYVAYATVALAWKGETVGEWACGHFVTGKNGRRPSLVRALLRSVLVSLFLCLFGLPLLTLVGRRSKRGWHDILSGTCVILRPGSRTRPRYVAAVVWLGFGAWIGLQTAEVWQLYGDHRGWCADANAAAEKRGHRSDVPIDASSLGVAERDAMAAWLVEHAQDPADLVVEVAARHRVTLLGEIHGKKQYLAFLNRIIPDLYHRAGVRTVVLECCVSDQNDQLTRLVTAGQFDSELAMELARGGVWHTWGWKGYWDVLETVWKLNRSLAPEEEPLQVVGISPRADLISFALVKGGRWTEKLRLVRLARVGSLARIFYHDAFYARCVAHSAFDEGRRTVVLVGAAHAVLGSSFDTVKDGQVIARSHRMGSMLYGRYGDQVGQIMLHNSYGYGKIAKLIEECTRSRLQAGVAFPVADSPFASLRDSSAASFSRRRPDLCFADLVSSYVILAPENEMESCDWLKGFVSRRMFGRYKPFYEMLCRRKLANHDEADQHVPLNMDNL